MAAGSNKRCEGAPVGYLGQCFYCDADPGEACRKVATPISVERAMRLNRLYAAAREGYRKVHPHAG